MNDVQYYIEKITSKEVQEFIRINENMDEKKIVLKNTPVHGVPAPIVANQISGRRKAKYKLPTFYASDQVVYPPGLNLEQSSSEKTATFKSTFLKNSLPQSETLVDLTAGFGIDSFFLGKTFKAVTCVEPQNQLLKISCHNHSVLGGTGFSYFEGTAEMFLSNAHHSTVFYIDPSRRVTGDKKVFRLRDCDPDITALQSRIFEFSDFLLVKTSPLLDLTVATSELSGVCKIVVLSVDNDCKELLFLCQRNFSGEPEIHATCLFTSAQPEESLSFTWKEEKNAVIEIAEPHSYIYEPNVAVLKAGAFKSIAARTGLKKIHANTHLYTSNSLVNSFPGRIFQVVEPLKSDRKYLEKVLPRMKVNIILRNYPESVETLRKKLNLVEGGEDYLLGFTTPSQKMLCLAKRLK